MSIIGTPHNLTPNPDVRNIISFTQDPMSMWGLKVVDFPPQKKTCR